MDSLKTELKESFIKPLKFKFLVEKLRKNSLANIENVILNGVKDPGSIRNTGFFASSE
jgi:hypothetical protein